MQLEHVPAETTARPALPMNRNVWALLQTYSSQAAMLLLTGLDGNDHSKMNVLRGIILQSLVATCVFDAPGTQSWP